MSTFVGTGVAYVVTPSLNWINERALGLHQLGQADTKPAAEEFFRQVTRTAAAGAVRDHDRHAGAAAR